MNKLICCAVLLCDWSMAYAAPLFHRFADVADHQQGSIAVAAPVTVDNNDALLGQTLDAIEIRGIEDEEQKENAYLFLTLNQLLKQEIQRPDYVNFLIEDGAREIAESQQPFGYYDTQVDVQRVYHDDGLRIIYDVRMNQPVRLSAVDVALSGEAEHDEAFVDLLHNNPLAQGQQLNHQAYEQYKGRFKMLASARGYFDASFVQSRIYVHPKEYRAEIVLHFNSGVRYQFSTVSFSETELDPDLLQRFVSFEPGEPYTSKDVAILQQDLQGSGYFSQVLVGGNPDVERKTVPVDAQLDMNKNKRYVFGIGYSTDQGMRAKFDFNRRWVNARGHTFAAKIFVSEKESNADAIYRMPSNNPTTDYYYARVGGHYKESNTYDSRRIFVEGGYNFTLGHWTHRYGLVAAWEDFTIGLDQAETWLIYPQARWVYTSTTDRLKPETGYQFAFGLRAASDKLLSDVAFVQADIQTRGVYQLNQQSRFIARFDLGATHSNDFHRLPVSLRYFTGGDRSVRGYAFENIGPRDASETNIGGRYLAVGSMEYEYYFKPDWALAVFVDTGDAFSHGFDAKVGAGLGVHWRSPVGPIAIDVAHGFSEPFGDRYRLHLTIGTELDL